MGTKVLESLQNRGKSKNYIVLAYSVLILLIFLDGKFLSHGTLSRLYFLPVLLIAWYGDRNAFIGILLSAIFMLGLRHSGLWTSSPVSPFISMMDAGSILLYGTVALFVRQRLNDEMDKARLDPLTGIYNRRGFEEHAQAIYQSLIHNGRPVSVAYIDLDHFKLMNDSLGHEAGDRLLVNVAHTIQGSVRSTDLVARLGGDEFIIMIPGAGPQEVKVKLSQMQNALSTLFDQGGWPVSASIGAVTFYHLPSIEQMISRADSVMYAVKRGNKDGLKYEITRGERVSTAVELH